MPPALFELTAATALYAPPALRWSGAPWCVVLSYGHLALNRRLRPGRPAPARPSATLAACLAVILRRPPPRQVLLLNRPGTDLLRHAAPRRRPAKLMLVAVLSSPGSFQDVNGAWVKLPGLPLDRVVAEVGLVD